jgi:hypothetical protein
MAGGFDEKSTYPPLDVLKPVAAGVWIVDSGPLRAFGMPLPVRMTVIRLSDGELWLHSPTRFTAELGRELTRIGRIGHLVAPAIAHWSFLKEWQENCPGALTWAVPGLRERTQVKKAGVRVDRDLSDTAPPLWVREVEHVLVRGWVFSEIDFFHRPTRTLVLTDLVQNFEAEKLPRVVRPVARVLGVLAPNGKAPIYVRWLVRRRRREASRAAAQLVKWDPERVIFSHGRWFERDGTKALERSLRWLLP